MTREDDDRSPPPASETPEPPSETLTGSGRPSVLVYNEQLKYTATWFNTIAAGAIIAGFVAPLAALAAGGASQWTILLSLVWIPAGIALHLVARMVLTDLKDGT
ncbi:hypothetical protein ACFQI3_13315 [Hansschlegelia quercus]|uniref:Uncharacterized protein n=1 Tax=Hansschlegelia quercus TaxID=2528245 RepID=A0A4Q9GAE8_9HYPH|nr:hypothetical protein [Hansschlegelia quercus]TBN47965.1 hypothetical protein EYR15_15225 [Hansschlegelia quercus]